MQDDIKVVKNHASILIESLKPHGVALKKTEALEIISKLQGRLDWNRLRAKLKTPPPAKLPVNSVPLADAMMLVDGRGRNKTETLKTLFELECAEGVTAPMMVSIAGSGHTLGLEADLFFKRIPRVTVTYDSAGIVKVDWGDFCNGKGLLVNLISAVKGSRAGAGYALSQLLTCHRVNLRSGMEAELGSMFVDDFHQISDAELDEAAGAIGVYAQSHCDTFRRLVLTSEVEVPKKCQRLFGMQAFYLVSQSFPRPSYVAPEQEIEVSNPHCEENLANWSSESLADRVIVADICWWVSSLNRPMNRGAWQNGKSRAAIIPGKTLWFSDLRASLIR